MTCRDCALWDIDAARDKAGRVRKDRAARCKWISIEPWPDSVSSPLYMRPKASYVSANCGALCPCFVKREGR